MEQLHLLYGAYFPPGSENLITLFWRYYAEKLASFTRGGSHVHQIIESRFINIPWHLFWPSLYDLALMDKIMINGAPESAPLITQIVVRIPWLHLIQYQVQQPLDAYRVFYSLLFSLLASCISRPSNYAKIAHLTLHIDSRTCESKSVIDNSTLTLLVFDFKQAKDQEEIIAKAFEDVDVIGDFEAEKEAVEAAENPKDIDLTLHGWGSWTGPGITDKKKDR
ncbi:hypothetical protein WUBG_13608 [Wuchereria bancrofti]|uniref:Epg5-like central TPR repeats domain-containing protein n=1 Tax=Wuchereria bancrofti TaxID=6293 RepID=J9AMH8_WUCBA|nr:hypothetical protein WUBG_13608 [Wuchereria bancrofti]